MYSPKQIPMLSGHAYTSQINIRVSSDLKQRAQMLKLNGVDTSELFRKVIESTVKDAIERLGLDQAG
jgi:hypothetical protein